MSEIVTSDTILDYLQNAVEQHQSVGPELWLDAAQKLVVLMGEEEDALFGAQSTLARLKQSFIEDDPKNNVSAAQARLEATDEYLEMRKLDAKIKRIMEFIRISKLQARMRQDELRSY